METTLLLKLVALLLFKKAMVVEVVVEMLLLLLLLLPMLNCSKSSPSSQRPLRLTRLRYPRSVSSSGMPSPVLPALNTVKFVKLMGT